MNERLNYKYVKQRIMTKILLKNGQVGCSLGVYDADVLIENGKIVDTYDWGQDIKADKIIDCKGKLILPGLIDAHVHMREPGQAYKEDWETGSKAAVAGGITTVCDMPNNVPPVLTAADLEAKRALVAGRAYCNYGFYMGFDGQNFGEINKVRNVAGVKIYVANSTGNMGVGPETIGTLFKKCDKLIVAHAEDEAMIQENARRYFAELERSESLRKADYLKDQNTETVNRLKAGSKARRGGNSRNLLTKVRAGRNEAAGNFEVNQIGHIDPAVHSKIRTPECAAKAVQFLCDLARANQRRLHIAHISSDQELAIILEYRDAGVTCEVAPHHLLLSDDDYTHLGNFVKVNPPVRSRTDIFTMWKALKFGEIDIIATDHAPHTIVEKELGYVEAPAGVPELDTLLPILLNAVNDGGLEVKELVKFCCEGPARIFGMKGKGQVEAGFDADLVVVDMELSREVERKHLFTKCGWSPYEGSVFKGWPVMTFVGGEMVFKNGKIVGERVGREIEFGP